MTSSSPRRGEVVLSPGERGNPEGTPGRRPSNTRRGVRAARSCPNLQAGAVLMRSAAASTESAGCGGRRAPRGSFVDGLQTLARFPVPALRSPHAGVVQPRLCGSAFRSPHRHRGTSRSTFPFPGGRGGGGGRKRGRKERPARGPKQGSHFSSV